MTDEVSRLNVPKPEAAQRLRAQVEHGLDICIAIGRATNARELDALRSRSSRWSQRNEQELAFIFGEPERIPYRSVGLPQTTPHGFAARQERMERATRSRLNYLENSIDRVTSAPENDAKPAVESKRWWRAILDHPWTIALAAPVIAAPLILLINNLATGNTAGSVQLTGTVVCESGRPVVGVWIAASTGQIDSGLAHLGPAKFSGIDYPVNSISGYSYRLPHGGTYAVHVGCGGTGADWDSSNYSPLLSGDTADLRCDDPKVTPTRGSTPEGSCTPVTS
jgi:hypothetical protein